MDLALLSWGDQGWGDEMVRGAALTLMLAVCAFSLGVLIGIGGAACKLSARRPLMLAADAYTTVFRGVPELLIIFLIFYGGGQFLRAIASGLFGYDDFFELPLFATGVICFALSAGAYATEVIRGAVLAVPSGQMDAARAIGLPGRYRFWRILVPQAARHALPGLGNVWQLTLKETALISVIGLAEIMRQAQIAAGSTQEPFTFYLAAFFLYLVLAALSGRGFNRAEIWASRGV